MRLDVQQSLKQIVDTCDIPSFELRLSEPKLRWWVNEMVVVCALCTVQLDKATCRTRSDRELFYHYKYYFFKCVDSRCL